MSKVLANIYDKSAAFVFGTVFLEFFGDSKVLFFDEKPYIYFFLFIQKTVELFLEKHP